MIPITWKPLESSSLAEAPRNTQRRMTKVGVGDVLYPEETPSFNFKMQFQSNLAFLVALFILWCSLAWAIPDHRRRLLELATEEQEDRLRLYLSILSILFVICLMGSYYAFNRLDTKNDRKSNFPTLVSFAGTTSTLTARSVAATLSLPRSSTR